MELRVDTAALEDAGATMRQSATSIADQLGIIENEADQLAHDWTGAASTAAQARLQRILARAHQRAEVLQAAAAATEDAAERYRQLDQQAAQQLT